MAEAPAVGSLIPVFKSYAATSAPLRARLAALWKPVVEIHPPAWPPSSAAPTPKRSTLREAYASAREFTKIEMRRDELRTLHTKIIRSLVRAGADPEEIDAETGKKPADFARALKMRRALEIVTTASLRRQK